MPKLTSVIRSNLLMTIFFSNIYAAFLNLYNSVVSDPSLLWLLVPVVFLWLATEVYFGEYSQEKFGFSSIFTGAISMLWLSFITLRVLFSKQALLEINSYGRDLWVVLIFAIYALFVLYVSFRHKINEEILEVIASPRIIYFVSLLLILFGVGDAELGLYSFLGILIIFAFFSLLFSIIKKYWLAGFWGEVEAVQKAAKSGKEIIS